VGFDLRERGSRCDQVCADGRDLPCGDAFPSGGTGGPAPVVEQVAYLRQHWKRATRYARNPCRVSGAMAYALRGTCGTTWCDRPCGDNSRSGMDGHGRGSATIYARRGTGFSVGAGSVESAPIRGIVDGSCDRLCVRAGRSSATDYAHDSVTASAEPVTGRATTYADVPTRSG
jgi:hypothetical protein